MNRGFRPPRAGAFVTDRSDFDAYVILHEVADGWHTLPGATVEVWPMTVEAFRTHGLTGTQTAWDRPTFLCPRGARQDRWHDRPYHGSKAQPEPKEVLSVVPEALGAYMYCLARSIRNIKAGRMFEGRLEAMESLAPMLTVAFALEGRIRPFNKWLGHELRRRPLPIRGFLDQVQQICEQAQPIDQMSMLRAIEARARRGGFDAAVDGWRREFPSLRDR